MYRPWRLADSSSAPQGRLAFATTASARVRILSTEPAEPLPLANSLGRAKKLAAPLTSPWRSRVDQSRITATALSGAELRAEAGARFDVGLCAGEEPPEPQPPSTNAASAAAINRPFTAMPRSS